MMKRMIISIATTAAMTVALNVYAVEPGLYLGLMLGPATNNGGNEYAQKKGGGTTLVTPRSQQFGTRLYLGYKMNQYAGYEVGLDYFSKFKYDTKNVTTCNNPNANVKAFDFLVKGTWSFYDSFDVFGKAGAAFTYVTSSGSLNPDQSMSCGVTNRQSQFKPALAIGGSYDLNENWVMDLTWSRILVGGILKNIDTYQIGISYHFVDTHCGQFLC
jgi:hypothetical protein